jgi:predicted kinase
MNKTIEILVGIPCSGKSTYVKKRVIYCPDTIVSISRDDLRELVYGKHYKPNKFKEEEITKLFNYDLEYHLSSRETEVLILDNTHCKEKYIDEIINKFGKQFNIKITFFDYPLWKAQIRNVLRYLKNGKWIPIKIISQMYKNYNKISRNKYKNFVNLP